jgi:hypothetical protein
MTGLIGGLLGASGCSDVSQQNLVQQWGLSQEQWDGREVLMVHVGGKGLRLAIARDRADKARDSVLISNVATTDTILEFKCHSVYGSPEVIYSGANRPGHKGFVWHDLDGDGCFDLRTDVQDKRASIRVEERWVKARMRDGKPTNGATTDDGTFYRFDPETGTWVPKQISARDDAVLPSVRTQP